MNQDSRLAAEDVLKAIRHMSGGSGLRLVKVKWQDNNTGALLRPNLKSAIEQSGMDQKIYWLAIREEESKDAILTLPLYAEKFEKLIRKWNRGDTSRSFELETELIDISDAVLFYEAATHKRPDLVRAVLRALQRAKPSTKKRHQ